MLASEACRLLLAGEFSSLAAQFGYAISLGRDPSKAIQEDLRSSLAHLRDEGLDLTAQPLIEIKYFKPNDQLHAVAECRLATAAGHQLLVELVVTAKEGHFRAILEQVSAAA